MGVAVAISGGVDSAVAAALLKELGYEVVGIHLRFCTGSPKCGGGSAERSARGVARRLDIPFIVWDLEQVFREEVVGRFLREYREGRTPVPCAVCNQKIKFGVFLDRALSELGVDKVATGHYVRVVNGLQPATHSGRGSMSRELRTEDAGRRCSLWRGLDEQSDQSYFLWTLSQDKLERILFPVGHMTKQEVRAKAREFDLPCAERPKSQGICFVGSEDVTQFLRKHLPIEKGPVKNMRGEVVGEHDGVWFYTEGQRHGPRIEVRGKGQRVMLPLYVIRKDIETNTLLVGRGEESKIREFAVGRVNWISEQAANSNRLVVGIRIRHLGEIMTAALESNDSKPLATSQELAVTLSTPTRGIAPGQSAVFYRDEEVLGGGVIKKEV